MENHLINVVQSQSAQFVTMRFEVGHEHKRSDCPDFQHWIIPSGHWRIDRPTLKTEHLRINHHIVFEPFEKCHRIVQTQGTASGLRLFRSANTEKLRLGLSHLWKMSYLAYHGQLDSLALDCMIHDAPAARKSNPPNWLLNVSNLLHDDPTIDWEIKQFANFAGISPSQLIHEFKLHFGERLFEMRNRLRIERWLQFNSNPTDLGFYDQSHFIRTSKRHLGVAPKTAVLYKTVRG
jgi:AraC-like DNA-binding protein